MPVDTTYQGAKGQDRDGVGIFLPSGVELNSYLSNTYTTLSKEIKGGLHYIRYVEDLTDNSYAGIFSNRSEIGMLAYCHLEYNAGSPIAHNKFYVLKDFPHTDINNWEELTTGSMVQLTNVDVVNTVGDLPTAQGDVEQADVFNVLDARLDSDVKEIVNDSTTLIRISDYVQNVSSLPYQQGIKYRDIVIGQSIQLIVSGDPVSPITSSTEYIVGDFSTQTDGNNDTAVFFELLDDQSQSIDSTNWDSFNTANSTITAKRFTSYSATKIARILTVSPFTVEFLDIVSPNNVSPADVAFNTQNRHNHTNKALLDSLTNSGNGEEFLADDGSYKTPNSNALVPNNIGDTLVWDGTHFNIPLGVSEVADMEFNINWDVETENDNPYTFQGSNNAESTNLVVDIGCKVYFNTSGMQFKFIMGQDRLEPDFITGDWSDGIYTPLPSNDTFTGYQNNSQLDNLTQPVTENQVFNLEFTKENLKRLKANAQGFVFLDESDSVRTGKVTVRFGMTVFFGYSEDDVISDLSDLNNTTQQLFANTSTITFQVDNVQTNDSNKKYGFFVIPTDYGDINQFIEKFSGQGETLLTVDNSIDPSSSESLVRIANINSDSPSEQDTEYRVYRFRQEDNYQTATQYLKIIT